MAEERSVIISSGLKDTFDMTDLFEACSQIDEEEIEQQLMDMFNSLNINKTWTFDKAPFFIETRPESQDACNHLQCASEGDIFQQGFDPAFTNDKGQTPLMAAAASGQLQSVKEIIRLNNGRNLDVETTDGLTALAYAAIHKHNKVVKVLLKAGASVNNTDQLGNTALMWCCYSGHKKGAQKLLDKGADVDAANIKGQTPLIIAAQLGHTAVVRNLLHHNCKTETCDLEGHDAMYYAIASGRSNVFKEIINFGAKPHQKYYGGNSLSHIAAYAHQVECLECLKEAGADILNEVNDLGMTPLLVSSCEGCLDMVKYLIDQGSDPNLKCVIGRNCLMWAADRQHVNIVSFIVKHIHNVNEIDVNGDTALILLARRGNVEGVNILLRENVKTSIKNKKGFDAFMAARHVNHREVVAVLTQNKEAKTGPQTGQETKQGKESKSDLQSFPGCDSNASSVMQNTNNKQLNNIMINTVKGNMEGVTKAIKNRGDVNFQDIKGRTALMVASCQGNVPIVQELLLHGANPHLKTTSSLNAVAYAVDGKHTDIIDILVKHKAVFDEVIDERHTLLFHCAFHGDLDMITVLDKKRADLNYCDSKGCTPLMAACQEGHLPAVEYLLTRGADASLETKEKLMAKDYAFLNSHNEIVKYFEDKLTDSIQFNEGALMAAIEMKDVSKALDAMKENTNVNFYFRGHTPVMVAAITGQDLIIEILCANNANVNLHSAENKKTAIFHACTSGHKETMKFLLDNGAYVDSPDSTGNTTLMVSSYKGQEEEVKILLEAGADANRANTDGKTSLMLASAQGYLSIINLLLQYYADVTPFNNDGFDALRCAVNHNREEVVKFLLSIPKVQESLTNSHSTPLVSQVSESSSGKGKYVKNMDKKIITPLMLAAKKGCKNIATILLKHGAKVNATEESGAPAIFFAAVNANFQIARELIENGADINMSCRGGENPLLYCSLYGPTEGVKLFLESGANVNQCDDMGRTALMRASHEGSTDSIKLLLSHGADPNLTDEKGLTALYFAMVRHKMDAMEELVKCGAHIDSLDDSPLVFAAYKGRLSLVKLLLSVGADPNCTESGGWTPLMTAAKHGHVEVAEYLISKGAKMESREDARERTALFIGTMNNNCELVQMLLSKGADVDCPDNLGDTPLMYACNENLVELVDILVKGGADVDMCNYKGFNALMCTEIPQIAESLIKAGSQLDVVNYGGNTALIIAAARDRKLVAKILLENDAEIDKRNAIEYTALHIATYLKLNDMVKFLATSGATVNTRDLNGQTPLMFASETGNIEVVKCLVEHGASLNQCCLNGRTALDYANLSKDDKVESYLLEKGAENGHSKRPLKEKIINKSGILEALCKNQALQDNPQMSELKKANEEEAEMIARRTGRELSPTQLHLHNLCVSGTHDQVVFYYLVKEVSLEFVCPDTGCTPIHTAATHNHPEIVAWLAEAGADINSKSCGTTTLMHSIEHGNLDTVDVLLSCNPDVNLTNKEEQTPLICAVLLNRIEIVERLLQFDVNIEHLDNEGNTALMIAKSKRYCEIEELISKKL